MQSLRFKPISHLQEAEINSFLNALNQQQGKLNEELFHNQNDGKGKRNKLIPQGRIQPTQDQPFRQASLANFISSNPQNLIQQSTRLRFQKLALEGLVKKLQEESNRKDELIRTLRVQTNIKSLPRGQGLRNTVGNHQY